MIRKRLPRSLSVSGLSVLMLLSLMLLTPMSSLAATPNWQFDGSALLPSQVKVDGVAGYSATVFNPGPSNISQLQVTAWFQQPYDDSIGADTYNPPGMGYSQTPVYAALLLNGSEVVGACPKPWGAPLVCSISALAANQSATLIVAYQTSGTDPAGIYAWWQSTGSGSSFCTDSDQSHADCLATNVGPTTISDSEDFGGGFALDTSLVANDPVTGSSNPEQVGIYPPAKNIAVTVADGTELSSETINFCPDPYTCVLQAGTAELRVGDGTNQYGLFEVVITFDKSLLQGINFKKLTLLHVLDSGEVQEIPGEKSCDGTRVCATFTKLPGGGGQVIAWFDQNGLAKWS